MTSFLQLAFLLALLLLCAKAGGYLSVRLGQPSVLGELVVGILLGPSLIDLLHIPILQDQTLEHFITELGQVGVLLLMFIAGLQLHLDELRGNAKVSVLAGTLGLLASTGLGWGLGTLSGFEPQQAWFLGIILGASSVSISAQTLMELNALRSRTGLGLLGAAVFDDVLAIFLLSIFTALTTRTGAGEEILLVFLRIAAFICLAIGFGVWVLPRIVYRVRNLPISQNMLTLAIVVLLAYALAAELVGGLAAITGAFLAGLMFARTHEREHLEPRISALAYGFFVPIFFVDIGLRVNLGSLGVVIGFVLLLLGAAILGKFLGAGLGARGAGFSWAESARLGMGMVPRGEVSLIIASVGLQDGLVDHKIFAAVVGIVILGTLVTPPAMRLLFRLPDDWQPRWPNLRKYNKESPP